ncbi:hypothetical protein [Streptomyces sp. NPDC093568]|uniref:hypothetical protein n=1 Tax=Streptomyces sp. NPDC093568 TaxID=3366041 RepID=UPI003803B1B1
MAATALALLEQAARRRPLLVVLDDLQWVDSSSAEVFGFLRRRIAALRAVLLSAVRTMEGKPCDTAGARVPLQPLAERQHRGQGGQRPALLLK